MKEFTVIDSLGSGSFGENMLRASFKDDSGNEKILYLPVMFLMLSHIMY